MMPSRNRQRLFGAALLAVMFVQSGCGTTSPTKFFVLSPAATLPAPAPDGTRVLRLGVGPLDLPEYLDRPQIVTRTANSELRLADDRRWAEPLRDNFTGPEAMTSRPPGYYRGTHVSVVAVYNQIDYQIIVKVLRFEGDTSGNVTLVARWTIPWRSGKEDPVLAAIRCFRADFEPEQLQIRWSR